MVLLWGSGNSTGSNYQRVSCFDLDILDLNTFSCLDLDLNLEWTFTETIANFLCPIFTHLQVHGIETVQKRKTRAQWVGLWFMWFLSEGSSRFHHQCCLLNRWSLPTAPLPSEHRGVDVTLLLQRLAEQTEALADQWPEHWHVRSSVWDWGNGSQTWSLSVIFLVLSWY